MLSSGTISERQRTWSKPAGCGALHFQDGKEDLGLWKMKVVFLALREWTTAIITPFGPPMMQCTRCIGPASFLSELAGADVDVWMFLSKCVTNPPAWSSEWMSSRDAVTYGSNIFIGFFLTVHLTSESVLLLELAPGLFLVLFEVTYLLGCNFLNRFLHNWEPSVTHPWKGRKERRMELAIKDKGVRGIHLVLTQSLITYRIRRERLSAV